MLLQMTRGMQIGRKITGTLLPGGSPLRYFNTIILQRAKNSGVKDSGGGIGVALPPLFLKMACRRRKGMLVLFPSHGREI